MSKQMIFTPNAPTAIGTYSQAIKTGNTVYLSGQIPLDPKTNQIVENNFVMEVTQVFENLSAVAKAAGGELNQIVKLTVFLTDFAQFPHVNEVMAKFFKEPYPARSTVQVAALPKNVRVEVEAVMVL